jgi:hypothetical protein
VVVELTPSALILSWPTPAWAASEIGSVPPPNSFIAAEAPYSVCALSPLTL